MFHLPPLCLCHSNACLSWVVLSLCPLVSPRSLFLISRFLSRRVSRSIVPLFFSEHRICWRIRAAGDEHSDVGIGKAATEATKGSKSLQPIHLEVSRASAGAIEAVESQGGTVTCAHFNRLALRALVRFAVGRCRRLCLLSSVGSDTASIACFWYSCPLQWLHSEPFRHGLKLREWALVVKGYHE